MSRHRLATFVVLTAASLALSACGAFPTSTAEPARSAGPARSAAPAAPPSAKLDAAAVFAELKAAGLKVASPKVYTADSDPEKLLGRPGAYQSRIGFLVPGTSGDEPNPDGYVEVFADQADAAAFWSMFAGTLTNNGLKAMVGYHWINGPVLVRLAYRVAPKSATPFGPVVAGLRP